MKALVGAFNQEKALVGAFSVITNLWIAFVWISSADTCLLCSGDGGGGPEETLSPRVPERLPARRSSQKVRQHTTWDRDMHTGFLVLSKQPQWGQLIFVLPFSACLLYCCAHLLTAALDMDSDFFRLFMNIEKFCVIKNVGIMTTYRFESLACSLM